jgi:hypothetical protein
VKKLIALIGAISVLSIPHGTAIAESLPKYVDNCLIEGANSRALRHGGLSEIDVYSQFESSQYTYLEAQVKPLKGGTWSIVVQYDDRSCDFLGDDYVSETGLYSNMPVEIVKEWTIQMTHPRIQAVGKKEMKDSIKHAGIDWHPGQILAFQELGVW